MFKTQGLLMSTYTTICLISFNDMAFMVSVYYAVGVSSAVTKSEVTRTAYIVDQSDLYKILKKMIYIKT